MLDTIPAENEKLQARIVVIGAGGAGCNAINNMIDKKLPGVQFVSMNTDTQSLSNSMAPTKIQLGQDVTQGLGAGANPDVGRAAAVESESKIQSVLKGAHMVFITAGMGGGTGTGSAPVIARLSKDMDILTVGVVTRPFKFERRRRAEIAESGIRELQQFVDTLIIIPNENLFRLNDGPTTLTDAFAHADNVLLAGVRGVTDLIVQEGKINLDFNDIKTVMKEMGKAVMGTGEASGENRARDAALQAINNPLLEDISLRGASSVLINITSGNDVTLDETNEAINTITEDASPNALVIFGLTINEELGDSVRISMIATGIEMDNATTATSVNTVCNSLNENFSGEWNNNSIDQKDRFTTDNYHKQQTTKTHTTSAKKSDPTLQDTIEKDFSMEKDRSASLFADEQQYTDSVSMVSRHSPHKVLENQEQDFIPSVPSGSISDHAAVSPEQSVNSWQHNIKNNDNTSQSDTIGVNLSRFLRRTK